MARLWSKNFVNYLCAEFFLRIISYHVDTMQDLGICILQLPKALKIIFSAKCFGLTIILNNNTSDMIIIFSNQDGHKWLLQRACLDYRRLEEAHFKYSILKVQKDYPDCFRNLAVQFNVNETLEEMGPLYYKAFSDRYKSQFISYLSLSFVMTSIIDKT